MYFLCLVFAAVACFGSVQLTIVPVARPAHKLLKEGVVKGVYCLRSVTESDSDRFL